MPRPLRRSAARRRQLRTLLCFPLLVLLHLLFILSSLVLRISEAFAPTPAPGSTPKDPPGHIALVLLSGLNANSPRSRNPWLRRLRSSFVIRWTRSNALLLSSWLRRSGQQHRKRHGDDKAVAFESTRRMISWAAAAGVSELSIYDDRGLLDACKDQLVREHQRLPVSPPHSRSPSPPSKQVATQSDAKSYGEVAKTDTIHEPFNPVTSFTVFRKSAPLNVHLLSPDSKDIIAHLARDHLESRTEPVSQAELDQEIRDTLHFRTDPDLLIVHRIKTPSFLGALLPRAPPELGGFPFWPLRITEIYMHPVPLPIPGIILNIFTPLLDRSRTSSLSLLRKTAKRFPNLPRRKALIPGIIQEQEWEGAMRAWQQVEQRLGK